MQRINFSSSVFYLHELCEREKIYDYNQVEVKKKTLKKNAQEASLFKQCCSQCKIL